MRSVQSLVLTMFLSLIVANHTAMAADACKRVNLLNRKWGQFPRQMPLYNQGSYGICYAYVATQMVDFWRETHGGRIGKMKMAQSTPAFAALLSRLTLIANLKKANQRLSTLAGGSIGFALWGIRDMGMCKANVIQESLDKFATQKGIDTNQFMMLLDKFFSEHRKNQSQMWGTGFVSESLRSLFGKPRPKGPDYEKLRQAMAPFLKGNEFTLFAHKVLKPCFDRRNIYLNSRKIPEYKFFALNEDPLSYQERIGKLLTKPNAQPLGISYCANVLTSSFADELRRKNNQVSIGPGCHLHSSMIVGQRTRRDKCQYLVRNTWGDKCKYAWPCLMRDGRAHGIWVAGKSLLRNINQIYYLPEGEAKAKPVSSIKKLIK